METDAPKKRAKETNGGPAAKKAKEEEEEEEAEEEDKDKRTLFVRNLPFSVDEDQVFTSFITKQTFTFRCTNFSITTERARSDY
jgi:hypothetical protein